jgi:hypothetical protein
MIEMPGPGDRTELGEENDNRPLLSDLFWRDEILQVMYWYQGEGFGTSVTTRDLRTFLSADEELIHGHLERMTADGYLQRLDGEAVEGDAEGKPDEGGAAPRYSFTEYGAREGARRFADEFSDITRQGHGDCPPGCPICKDLPPEECAHCRTQEEEVYAT